MVGHGLWAFVVVGGFIILGLVMAIVMLRNKATGADEPVERSGPPPSYDDAGNQS